MAVKKWRRRARRDSGFRFYWIKNDLVCAFFSLFFGGGAGEGAQVFLSELILRFGGVKIIQFQERGWL